MIHVLNHTYLTNKVVITYFDDVKLEVCSKEFSIKISKIK